jgi:uncharacterized protein with PIN domain
MTDKPEIIEEDKITTCKGCNTKLKYNSKHIHINQYGVQFIQCSKCNEDLIVFVPEKVKNVLEILSIALNQKSYKKSSKKSFINSVEDKADYVISGDWIDDIF